VIELPRPARGVALDLAVVTGVHEQSTAFDALVRAVENLREEGRRRGVEPFRDLFSGGPDTPCRTTYRPELGAAPELQVPPTECVEVPLDEVRAAFVEAGEEPS
jgi:hypothetical protein